MDDTLVIMEGSLLFIFLILQWVVALLLWKVVFVPIFITLMDGSLVIMECSMLSRIFVTPMDGSHVILEGSLLSRFL